MSDVIISRRVEIPGSFNGGTVKVRSSKNLRAIVTHNRVTKSKPEANIHDYADGRALIGLTWPNGDFANVCFASGNVARTWFSKRASSVTFSDAKVTA